MFFGLSVDISAILEAHKRECLAFNESLTDLPIDEQERLKIARSKRMEDERNEFVEERRHQELCNAIRDSGKWF